MLLSAIIFSIELGSSVCQFDIYDSYLYKLSYIYPEGALYVKMELGAEIFNRITIFGYMKSYQTYNKEIYFSPFFIDYGFNAFLTISNLKIGFYHECNHPVLSSQIKYPNFYGFTSEFYLKYEKKLLF